MNISAIERVAFSTISIDIMSTIYLNVYQSFVNAILMPLEMGLLNNVPDKTDGIWVVNLET